MADRLVIFGSGGHAKVVVEAALASRPDREIVLLDDHAERKKNYRVLGIAVSGGREQLDRFGAEPVAVAIGDNNSRSRLLAWLTEQGHILETIIHPAAVVGDSVNIAEGAFLGAGAIAIADARIGAGAIINTGATVDHDCDIGEAAHIAPGVHLCGNVRIGARTLVGVGSVVRPGISVAADVVLGAGSVVVRDIGDAGTYIGNPARRLEGR